MSRRKTPGIPCPQCASQLSDVLETRGADGRINRRRECERGHRFTTHEQLAPEYVRGTVPAKDMARALSVLLQDAARARS